VQEFIDHTIYVEGEYVNDPDDRGGETRYGITKRVAETFSDYWEDYSWDGDMRTLPYGFAQDIYAHEYYYRPKFNLWEGVSDYVVKELFDTGVNMGTSEPVKYIQRWLNVFNRQEKYYPDLVVDGLLGSKTINAYKVLCDKRGNSTVENIIYNCLNALQCVNYLEIAESNPSQEKFVFGWVANRVDYNPF
jgi:lysozyme family protein|tara:strand:- start:5798 stop:6367 length:570 start_codon:yes stop_codon:yes gene_type:complete